MPSASEENHYQKAKEYELFAQFYKYTNPDLSIKHYKQHLHFMKLLSNQEPVHSKINQHAPLGKVRFFHALPSAESIDLYINGMRIFRDVPYKSVGHYLPLPEGKYQIDLYPSGQLHTVLISRTIQIKAGAPYTLIVAGNKKIPSLFIMEENHMLPLRETKLNCLNLNPDSAGIDIAVTGGDTIFSDLSYKKPSSYLGLTPMSIEFLVKCSKSKELILQPFTVNLHADEVYTMGIISSGSKHANTEIVFI